MMAEPINDPEDFRRAAAGCIASRNKLVEQNIPLAQWVASSMFRRLRMCRRELVSIGYETLLRIVPMFDPDRGVKFSSFAIPALRNEMRNASWTTRVITMPPDRGQYISDRTRAKRSVRAFGNGYPGVDLHLSQAQARGDSVTESEQEQAAKRAVMRELLEQVPERLRVILEQRFIDGLDCNQIAVGMIRTQNGGRLADGNRKHISGKRVQQLQMLGIRELERLARARGLTPDWLVILPRAGKFLENL